MGEEFRRRSLVARGHDRVVERDGHGPVIVVGGN